ncbi:hypothetical protein RintRC_6786 [Richelia intracellularis]|nr:hypothetical protein RintRC_6786 [Richelia intracellularis]
MKTVTVEFGVLLLEMFSALLNQVMISLNFQLFINGFKR